MVEAILIFQKTNFVEFAADGLVEPHRKTIHRLQTFFRLKHGGETIVLSVLPEGPLFADINLSGFSAAKLSRPGPAKEWNRRNPFAPITQMVPVSRTRKLLVANLAENQVQFRLSSFDPDADVRHNHIASIVDSDNKSVTVRGNAPGKTDLVISVEGQHAFSVRLVVRGAISIPINSIHLGPPRQPGAERAFITDALPGISRIYADQTNITFSAGTTTIALEMPMDGVRTTIDPAKRLVFGVALGPPNQDEQLIRFSDLEAMITDRDAITVFLGPGMRDNRAPNIVGAALGFGGKAAWFNTEPLASLANRLTLPAHEIGHSLGLQHITASLNLAYLMNPGVQLNNLAIPAETLEDFVVN
jgi:hypothetical protein